MNRKYLKINLLVSALLISCVYGIAEAQDQLLISYDKKVQVKTVNKIKAAIENKYKVPLTMTRQRVASGSFLFEIQGVLSASQKAKIEQQFSIKGMKVVITSLSEKTQRTQLPKSLISNRKPVK